MVTVFINHNLSQQQFLLLESWLDSMINKYSSFETLEVCVSGNAINFCVKDDSRRGRRLLNFLVRNIQFVNQNSPDFRISRSPDPWITKFIDLEVPMPMSIQHKHNNNQKHADINHIRQQAREVISRKRDEGLVALALSKFPYATEFLLMYDKVKRGVLLSEYERIELQLAINLAPQSKADPAAAKIQELRVHSVMKAANKTDDIMFIFQKQLEQNMPLNEDQESVLRTWEEMYSVAQ